VQGLGFRVEDLSCHGAYGPQVVEVSRRRQVPGAHHSPLPHVVLQPQIESKL